MKLALKMQEWWGVALGTLIGFAVGHAACIGALALVLANVLVSLGFFPEIAANAHSLGMTPWEYLKVICASLHA